MIVYSNADSDFKTVPRESDLEGIGKVNMNNTNILFYYEIVSLQSPNLFQPIQADLEFINQYLHWVSETTGFENGKYVEPQK